MIGFNHPNFFVQTLVIDKSLVKAALVGMKEKKGTQWFD